MPNWLLTEADLNEKCVKQQRVKVKPRQLSPTFVDSSRALGCLSRMKGEGLHPVYTMTVKEHPSRDR